MSSLKEYETRVQDVGGLPGAFAFCEALARRRYEHFPIASRLLSQHTRRHVAVLYAFARIADDFTDEPEYEGVRRERLEDWRKQLWGIGKEPPRHPVFLAMEQTLRELDLPREPFDDLLSAFLQDAEKRRYATFDEVADYCRRSADPLGRILLMIHGYRDPELFRLSDCICTAMKLATFWQNLSVDLKRDRIYIPEEDFKQFGYGEADLRMGVVNERYRDLMKHQWKRTHSLFEAGRALPSKLKFPLSWEIRLTWLSGVEVLLRIQRQGFDTLHRRPSLTRWSWARLLLASVFTR